MVAADIRQLIRCADTDFDANTNVHADCNHSTAKHDPRIHSNAYLDACFDCNTLRHNTDTDANADTDAGTDVNPNPDINFDACIHLDADRDGYANEFPYSDTDVDDIGDIGTGGSRPDRTAGSQRGDSELGSRGRRKPLRTVVVDF